METLTATVKQLTEILAQVGSSLAAATQKLEQTTRALFVSDESLTSTKEELEEMASALKQSKMTVIQMLKCQIERRDQDIEQAIKHRSSQRHLVLLYQEAVESSVLKHVDGFDEIAGYVDAMYDDSELRMGDDVSRWKEENYKAHVELRKLEIQFSDPLRTFKTEPED